VGINNDAKVVLYTPTYREYLKNETGINMDLNRWQECFGDKYVLLIRAHYAVSQSLDIKESMNIIDVSEYDTLNDLYVIADMMISDYSSTFFDYSILGRPMFCYAYDIEEYSEKRGLYLKLDEVLPCRVDKNEDMLFDSIINCDYIDACMKTKQFADKFVPNVGNASKFIVDKIIEKCEL